LSFCHEDAIQGESEGGKKREIKRVFPRAATRGEERGGRKKKKGKEEKKLGRESRYTMSDSIRTQGPLGSVWRRGEKKGGFEEKKKRERRRIKR